MFLGKMKRTCFFSCIFNSHVYFWKYSLNLCLCYVLMVYVCSPPCLISIIFPYMYLVQISRMRFQFTFIQAIVSLKNEKKIECLVIFSFLLHSVGSSSYPKHVYQLFEYCQIELQVCILKMMNTIWKQDVKISRNMPIKCSKYFHKSRDISMRNLSSFQGLPHRLSWYIIMFFFQVDKHLPRSIWCNIQKIPVKIFIFNLG